MLSISHHCLEIERRAQKPTGTSSACEASSRLLAWLVPALCQDPFPSLSLWILHCLVSHSCWSLSLCWDASFGPYCQWEGLGGKSFFLRTLKPRLCFLQMVRVAVESSDVWNPFLFFFSVFKFIVFLSPVFWNFSAMHYDVNLFSCIVQNILLVKNIWWVLRRWLRLWTGQIEISVKIRFQIPWTHVYWTVLCMLKSSERRKPQLRKCLHKMEQ